MESIATPSEGHARTTPPNRHNRGGRRFLPMLWLGALGLVSITVLAQQGSSTGSDARNRPSTQPGPTATTQGDEPHADEQSAGFLALPVLGAAINAHHISRLDWYLDAVDGIADMGVDSLVVVTPMWMEDVHANEIRFLKNRCPSDDQLRTILQRAKSHGLRTVLLPIVLLESAEEKEWRGVIRPTDWNVWWTSYEQFLDRFIKLANETDVDALYVGSELNTTESQVERWKHAVEYTRSRFEGAIGYSANWDRYDRVTFWDLVDFMSVSAYFELVDDNEEPTRDRLVAAWDHEREGMLRIAEQYDRPLILSEVGYPSLSTAARYPWNYVNKNRARADHAMQQRCFESFFDSWAQPVADRENLAAGFFLYHWDPYNDGHARDTGYGWDGKPSYDVIKSGFDRIKTLMKSQQVE